MSVNTFLLFVKIFQLLENFRFKFYKLQYASAYLSTGSYALEIYLVYRFLVEKEKLNLANLISKNYKSPCVCNLST